QHQAKRALEIAAAGGHNLILNGPPGSGKTLLAKTLPSILPPLSAAEILEVTKIYSVAGRLPEGQPVIWQRPFRAPHHSSSGAALIGGGRIPMPGEISLAHRGVLFLDEFAEFPRLVLETLRQPLEDGIITVSRAAGSLTFPARFTLIASKNPCPCGYATDPEKHCVCSPNQISNYNHKISGPILDRLDLQVEVPRLNFEKLQAASVEENSATVRERVILARERQANRFSGTNLVTNAEMGPREIQKYCLIDQASSDLLKTAMVRLQLSGRAYHRLLKTARTIADLAGEETIKTEHMAEALQYRSK
ncbi:MAG: YifB family Mg chelatase-like AAA ATPase, partial [Patescibacteria group bacterium]